MRPGSVLVVFVVAIAVAVRGHTWARWAESGFDVGDLLLAAIFAVAALTHGDPVAALGIMAIPSAGAASGAVATFLIASILGDRCRAWLWRRCRPWMKKTAVNAGGAAQALEASPIRWRGVRAVAFTASGALLEEILFRRFLQNWLAVAIGPVWAVPIQAAAFGLVHAVPMALAGAPCSMVAYCMLMPTMTGAALGLLAGYGLLYPWLVHWGLNFRAATHGGPSACDHGGRQENGGG